MGLSNHAKVLFLHEQISLQIQAGDRLQKLWAAVVLAALDDAIAEDRKFRDGQAYIARWARSRDGREVLSNAGIEPSERVVEGLQAFVAQGVLTSRALTRETQE